MGRISYIEEGEKEKIFLRRIIIAKEALERLHTDDPVLSEELDRIYDILNGKEKR